MAGFNDGPVDIVNPPGIPVEEKGAPLGVAELDAAGLVPIAQLPPITAASITGATGLAANPQYAREVVNFNPAIGATAGNIYKTWPEASAALTALAGYPTELRFIGACSIPTGGPYRALGVHWGTDQSAPATVTIDDGASFDGPMASTAPSLVVVSNATSSPMTAQAGLTFTSIGTLASVSSGALAAPLVHVPNGAIYAPVVGAKASVGDGANAVFGGAAGGVLFVLMTGNTPELFDNALSGPAGFTALTNGNNPGAIISTTHPALTGGLSLDYSGGGAGLVGADDSTAGIPSFSTVQEFIGAVFPIPTFEAICPDTTSGVPAVHKEGQRYYDSAVKTWVQQTDDVSVNRQEGEELWVPLALNNSGVDIDNGEVVYTSGASAGSPEISCAKADSQATADGTIGVATQDILNTALGRVTAFGTVNGIDTSIWPPGTPLYLSPTVAGGMTSSRPVAPNRTVVIGTVLVQDAATGSILVNVEKESRVVSSYALYNSNPPNGTFDLEGFYIQIVTGYSLTNATPYASPDEFFNSQAAINLTTVAGSPFDLTISGDSVDEATGAVTLGDSEAIAITGDGDYASVKKWLDAPDFTVPAGKTMTMELHRTRYWDNNNNNFRLLGSKWQFRPTAAAYSFGYTISKVDADGSRTVIETKAFSNADSPAWAGATDPGVWKRTDYATDIQGSGSEGIVVEFSNTGMAWVKADLRYVAT